MRRFSLLVSLFWGVAITLPAQNIELNFIEKLTTDTAFCRKSAEQGLPVAQIIMGDRYESVNDYEKAMEWYSQAAMQGDGLAYYNIAMLYFHGKGVERSYETAGGLMLEAINKGYENSTLHRHLAYSYFNEGKEQHRAQAVKWFRTAAGEGDGESMYMLGMILKMGLGTNVNKQESFSWFMKASDKFAYATLAVASCYGNGEGVAQNYPEAIRWFEKCLKSDAPEVVLEASYSLGICYLKGNGVTKDEKRAEEYLRYAAERGHKGAQQFFTGSD
ncbi:MAG: tetratricopeptide repeat protein [Bacteroidales bacterium]|jgi:TPR repeat protein|nr:tetratricopeptide repeat protein [Bacteroidales bacterium]